MERKNESNMFSAVMYLSLVLGALICAGINRMSIPGMMVQVCYSLILGVVFMTLLHAGQDMLWQQIPEKLIYLFSFSVALCLIGVASRYHVGMFILLPLAVVSRLDKLEIKVVTFGTLMMTYLCNAAFVNNDLGQMVYYLIMAVAFLMIVSMLQSREELPYAAVILTALCLALFVIRCRFQGSEMFMQRYYLILELGSLVFLALFCAILQLFTVHEPEEEVHEAPAQELDMMAYLQDDFPLIRKLKENDALYRHSCEISRLSEMAAKEMGFKDGLAAAGGMFHEAGRLLVPDNYMEGNDALAQTYGFSEELVAVIRQHNTGSEIPKSPEAAIVMLSDCILSTGEYLQENGKRSAITDEKLVMSIFANRMEKGSLAQAGLTQEQIERLRTFYVAHAFE